MLIGFLSSSIVVSLSGGLSARNVVELGPINFPILPAQGIPWLGAIILILFILKSGISIFLAHKLANFLARIEAQAAREITQKAYGGGLEGVKRHSRDEIVYAVQFGSPSIFNVLLNSVGTLVADGALFIIILGAFAVVSPWVSLAAIAYFGCIGFLIQFFIGRQLEKAASKITESIIESNSGLLDLGEVFREASTFDKKDFFINRIYNSRFTASRNSANQLVLQGAPRHIVETSLIVGIAGFIFVQSANGDLSSAAGVIGVFLAGGLRLTAALLPLQSSLLSIKQSLPPSERAFEFLGLETDPIGMTKEPENMTIENGPVRVMVKDLSFRYQGSEREALKNISLQIPAGSQAAFIGSSGSGKSTLADLILGLLEPTSGRVLLDGVGPAIWTKKYPGLLGYVPQQPGMVSGSIAQNIALGVESSQIDFAKLDKAIKDAHLSEIVDSLPNGIETDIGKRKDELSGGQLQRIGLARALYNQPKLLIMDEATSALDAESESEINKALDEMRGTVTVVLIAHRLNSIQRSDIVFLIDDGNLVTSGTFSQLVASNERVKNLAELMKIRTKPARSNSVDESEFGEE
jgi:ATP-binding cassette subfamily C protein